ncbi:alpha/beta hydrolase fold-domain-containing protein [Mycena olivaceomarginata]|nr:alpha/beta hydrolase fold-domain-containing protein [Mycena olivaceomarginata]
MRPVEKWKNSGPTRPLASRPPSHRHFDHATFGVFLEWKLDPRCSPTSDAVSSAPRSILIRENATIHFFFAVPLDYDAPSAEDKTVIAMRMFPATVPSAERLGSLFTNPGGPGGSGHSGLLSKGPLLSDIFEGRFDIVSWDPRGITNATAVSFARSRCHPTNLHRELHSLVHESNVLDFNDADLLTELCRDAVGDKILRSVTTVNVARDLDQMRKAVGDDGLHYWGFSYGTTLGATYVAMFPEHSERVVLDGVVYAPEQYTSLLEHGLSAGKYTNGVFEGFVSNCISAGPGRCALIPSADTTAAQLSARIWGLATQLETAPLPVPHPTNGAVPSVLHRGDPHRRDLLRHAIARAEDGNGTALAELKRRRRNITDAQRADNAGWGAGREMGQSEAGMAVSCGDAPPFEVGQGDVELWTGQWLKWRDEVPGCTEPTRWAGWFSSIVRCRHWGKVQPPPARYEGHWEFDTGLHKPKNPVIFVSNSFDPITPISKNARLLHNNGYGRVFLVHTKSHSATAQLITPSLCVAKALKAYMINGTVRFLSLQKGRYASRTRGVDIMFPPKDESGSLSFVHNDEDRELARTLRLLADTGIGMPSSLGW